MTTKTKILCSFAFYYIPVYLKQRIKSLEAYMLPLLNINLTLKTCYEVKI